MTNLEAMQDADLRQMIHDVELLERLRNTFPIQVVHMNPVDYKNANLLEEELRTLKCLIRNRWRELLEE